MKTETYFEPSDFQLLSKELPEDPCAKCPDRFRPCSGCMKAIEYEKIVEPYKAANILDIAVKIRLIMSHRRTIKELESQISNTLEEIPKEVLDNIELLKDSSVEDMKLF